MTTPRTHDDGRNDKQRAQQAREAEVEHERSRQRDQRTRAVDDERDRGDRRQLLEEKPHDFIQRTRPEDRLDDTSHHGQQTRDNVNPAIPSATPGEGGIVDPNTLGMESQAGVAPPPLENAPEQWPQKQKLPSSSEYDKGDNLQQQHAPREGEPPPIEPLRVASINEPPGSNIYPGADTGPVQLPGDGSALPPGVELPPLVLTDISPDSITAGSPEDLVLTVTGSGFGPNCVVMVDDEDMTTTLVNSTTLQASVPVAAEAGIVDVEVARGEDLSDVLTFEFVAPAGRRSSEKAERKPKKAEPRGKRAAKDKAKGKR